MDQAKDRALAQRRRRIRQPTCVWSDVPPALPSIWTLIPAAPASPFQAPAFLAGVFLL